MEGTDNNPCIAMVPSPGFSHLVPLIEFSKRLVVHHPHFHITFFIPTLGPPPSSTLSIFESLQPQQINFTILPQINTDNLKAKDPISQIYGTVTLSLPSLHEALSSFGSNSTRHRRRLVAMVVDPFAVDALAIAKQFNLKSYVFYYSAANSLSLSLNFPELHEDNKMVPIDYGSRELPQPLKLPGCMSLHGKDLPDLVFNRSCEAYKTLLHMFKRLRLADGIILNSFLDLEPDPITVLQQSNHKFPPVYPVGPILQAGSSNHINKSSSSSASECLTWLDNKPQNSVLYICFGSGGTLSHDQLHELALGLEMSGHKFLWVLRAPSEDAGAAYLSEQKEEPLEDLPEGFIERTKGRCFVVPSWAPQIEVLKHESTAGFLTHCGWNSTLEAIVYGKPMIAWPLFAEQKMNALMITEKFKVAVRPKGDENDKNGIVKREEVARVVKTLMEGDEGRELGRRIQMLKDAAVKALSEDGSSTRTLSNLPL